MGFFGEHLESSVIPKCLFHPSIFQGMEADDSQSPPHMDAIRNPAQGNFERLQLLVDRNTEGLEGPSRRIDLPLLAGGPGSPAARFPPVAPAVSIGFTATSLHDRPGNPAAMSLFSIGVDQVRQMLGLQPIHETRCRFPPFRIKAQIKRAIGRETETPVFISQLIARQTQIKNDSIHSFDLNLLKDLRKVREIRLNDGHWQIAQRSPSPLDRIAITIERYNAPPCPDKLSKGSRMPTSAHRSVHQYGASFWLKPLDDLVEQYGNMNGVVSVHRVGRSLVRRRNPRPLGVVRAQRLCLLSKKVYS